MLSRPKGLPMAITHSPTSRLSESPRLAAVKPVLASILIIAISVFGSLPTTLASYSSSSANFTTIFCAFSTTWLFVRIDPSASMTKPDPKLLCRCGPRGTGPPKNRFQKSLKGSSSPKGLPNSCGPRPSLTCVVEILTTTGLIFFASATKSGN